MPPVEVHPSAEPRVKLPQVQAILPSLFETLNRAAAEYGIPVSRYRMRVRWDPSEGYQELVVEQWVTASSQAASDYWDTFDPPLKKWIESLPPVLAQYADDNISVSVRWNNDGLRI
jgi:hypothetical protein